MRFVIDASFIASLLLPDEAAEKSAAQLKRMQGDGAVAPTLWQLEVANMLMSAQRRKRIDTSQFVRILEAVDSLPVTPQPALSPRQRGELFNLARTHELTAYDAAYLELALRLNLPLATVDDRLMRAARAEGAKTL
jgi:predicted nucleic acid-binding protein